MTSDFRRLINLIAISLIVHLCLFIFLYLFIPADMTLSSNKRITISIKNILNKESVSSPEESQTMIEQDINSPEKLNEEPQIKQKKNTFTDPDVESTSYRVGDEIESTNQEDKSVNELNAGLNVPTEKEKVAKNIGGGVVITNSDNNHSNVEGTNKNTELLKALGGVYNTYTGYDDETNDSLGEAEVGLRSTSENITEKEFLNEATQIGNYQFLTETELDNAFVKDPFNEKKGKELKLINIYIKEISDIILANWTNPLSPSQIKEGASVKIRIELNKNGFLESPRIYLQSRFPALDQSLMAAIKSSMSHQFNIPQSYLEKYAYLTLSWSSDGSEYELMPFEKDKQEK